LAEKPSRHLRSLLSGIQSDAEMQAKADEAAQDPGRKMYGYVTAYIAKSACRSRDQKELEELRQKMLEIRGQIEVQQEEKGELPYILRISHHEKPGKLSGELRSDDTVFFSDNISMRFQQVESRNLDTAKLISWVDAQVRFYEKIAHPSSEEMIHLQAFKKMQTQIGILSSVTVNTRCTPDSPELRKRRMEARSRSRRRS